MAISIPIISEFDGKGIERARKEFSQLEGVGAKAQFAIKKAALPAAAALGAVGVALGDAVKGAMEDAAAQKMLEKQLRNSAGANDEMVKSVEDSIGAMSRQLGIADDELRPAFANLTRATKDVTRSQELMTVAADISAQTGKSLESVSIALAKAENGQYAALKKLGIPMGENIRALMDQAAETKKVAKAQAEYDAVVAGGGTAKEQTKALDKLTEAQNKLNSVTVEGADYVKDLSAAFGGAAQEAAGTAAGQFQRLKISFDETKESIGAALLPALEAVLPVLLAVGNWAQQNPTAFLVIAGTISAVAAAIMAVNVAMALNPFGLIAIGVAALVTGIAVAYTKFEGFRTLVKNVINGIATYFEFVANAWIKVINTIIRGLNLVKPGRDIGLLGEISIGRMDTSIAPEPIGAVGADISRFQGSVGSTSSVNNTVINVNGGDPQQVVDALRRYQQLNGSIPITVSA